MREHSRVGADAINVTKAPSLLLEASLRGHPEATCCGVKATRPQEPGCSVRPGHTHASAGSPMKAQHVVLASGQGSHGLWFSQ